MSFLILGSSFPFFLCVIFLTFGQLHWYESCNHNKEEEEAEKSKNNNKKK